MNTSWKHAALAIVAFVTVLVLADAAVLAQRGPDHDHPTKVAAPAPPPPPPTPQEAYGNLDWCVHNSGVVDCPQQYLINTNLATCATQSTLFPNTGGGRACLMDIAIAAAHHDQCSVAFGLSLICQCHNDRARNSIVALGSQDVCKFLKGYDSYTDLAVQVAQALTAAFGG